MTRPITRGYFWVVLAALLWSTIGLFMRTLHDHYGFSALTLAFLRAGISCAISASLLLVWRRDLLRLTRTSLAWLMLYGIVGVGVFYFVYTQAILVTSVTTAVVLLYTAPAFVALMARRVWGEPLTTRKLLVIGLAFAGCALVVRAYDLTQLGLNAVGILFGLGAGFTYALFTMFSKAGMKQFSTWTLMTYELFFGALFLLPFQNVHDLAIVIQQPGAWIFLLGLVLGPTLGAITAFNLGVREVPASNASVVATIEPVMASLLAFVLLGERLEVWQLLGGAMVIAGAVWLSGQSR
jgi:DME family drug/metabolite transporter